MTLRSTRCVRLQHAEAAQPLSCRLTLGPSSAAALIPLVPPQLQAPSIEIGPTGTLKLYKSFQAYEFNKQGMTRNAMTSPLAAGAAALQQSYQVGQA